jgi:hypothetical protein
MEAVVAQGLLLEGGPGGNHTTPEDLIPTDRVLIVD